MIKKGVVQDGLREITFILPTDVSGGAVHLCGDFNDWSQTSLPMTRADDGRFETTVVLKTGRRYRYRYLIDNQRWENDWAADDYVANEFGGEDSAVDA